MHLRRVPALTAVLAVALTFGLGGCAQKINGTAVVAAGTTSPTSAGKLPTSTSKAPTTAASTPTPPTSGTKPPSKVKITTKKKTADNCDLLTPQEVADAVGAKPSGTSGCVQTTQDPFAVVLMMVTLAEYQGQAREIEVEGNTAYEIKEGEDCSVMVMLTDDPNEITPAFLASVTPVDKIDTCGIALKLATAAFKKLPNA